MANSDLETGDRVNPSTDLLDEVNDPEPSTEQSAANRDCNVDLQLTYGSIRKLLYTSHFLSTWNSRAFEFGAFLFLATIYTQTLLPASIYALTRAGAAATLSPWLGGYIDSADRLSAVRLSIVGQRVSVALSCTLLFYLCQSNGARTNPVWSYSALAILSVLACVEKLAAVMNTISVERDWVVVIANDDEDFLRSKLVLQISGSNIIAATS
jgi:solute carrier family 40 (iron-regulated transporter), member 1